MPGFNRHGLIAFFGLLVLVVGAHVLPGFSTSALTAEWRNGVHVIGFAGIAGLLYTVIRTAIPVRVVLVLLIVAVLGIVSEFVQSRFESIDIYDIARDMSGATIMLVAILLWTWSGRVRRGGFVLRGVAVITAVTVAVPLLYWSVVLGSYVRQFPVILDFDGRADQLIFLAVGANADTVDADEAGIAFTGRVLEAELLRRNRSSVVMQLPLNDWSDYQFLSFRIAITGAAQTRFDVHLNDGFHPGFRTRHRIGEDTAGPDPVTVRFPLEDFEVVPGRPALDPSRIYEIYFIVRDSQPGALLYLDDIRLE